MFIFFNGKHISYWIDSTKKTDFSPSSKEIKVDVAIIGGGIAGLTTGFLLKKQGLKVAIIESNRIIKGTTGSTTAKITIGSGLIYTHLLSTFGKDFALKFYNAYNDAFNTIHNIVEEFSIDCDYRSSPFYIYSSNKDFFSLIEKEYNVLNELKIPSKLVSDLPYPHSGIGILYENQAEFHPRKYLNYLAECINCDGSFVFEKTRAFTIKDFEEDIVFENENSDVKNSDLKRVITDKKDILAKVVVVATNAPIYDPDSVCNFITPDKAYIFGLYTKKDPNHGMFVNIDPFHSYRYTPTDKGELLIVLGEGHEVGKVEDTWKYYKKLNHFIEKVFDTGNIEYFWSNQDNSSEDQVPIIGETSQNNVYVATGFGSWGMTTGTIAGNVISYLILNKLGKAESMLKSLENIDDYSGIFNPQRFKNKKSSKDIKKQLKSFYKSLPNLDRDTIIRMNNKEKKLNKKYSELLNQYLLELDCDEAKIVNIGTESIAIYKNIDSCVYAVSSKSTHSGYKLVWNTAEKVWECPKFGSRFSYDGKVIHGPAIYDLNSYL